MKIRFGTTDSSESRALVLGFVMVTIDFCCWYFQLLIGWSHDLILSSRLSNMTLAKVNRHSCGLPYDDYRCSVLSITPNISQYCLNDAQITGARLLPQLLFVLQLCVIHELFSLSEDCIRFFFYALGVTSVFTFAVIIILIYHNTCAQLYVTGFLFLTGGMLFILTMCNTFAHDERRRRAAGNG
jgi:hypothetical protein